MRKTGESKGDLGRLAFKFENIGPIKKAKLKLGDLTVIAGANNTGKTYIVYALYGFLKMLRHTGDFPWYRWPPSIFKKRIPVYDIQRVFRRAGERFSDSGVAMVFSSSQDYFPKAAVDFVNEDRMGDRLEYFLASEIARLDGVDLVNDHIEFAGDVQDNVAIFKRIISSSVRRTFLDPFLLSSERSHSMLDDDAGKIDFRCAKPVKDNIDFTLDLKSHQKKTSEFADAKLFDDIKHMMSATYKYEKNGLRLVSKARKGADAYKISRSLASSSARGLLDLYFYMKHVAKKDQLLIIDGPESHLDVNNQMAFARLLARCVNAGIKVLIITHSDYIIKELNNLVMLHQDFPEKDGFLQRHQSDYTKNDFLKPESIRAYVCQDGRLDPCKVDNYGMIINFFDDAIKKINEVSNTLNMYLEEECD